TFAFENMPPYHPIGSDVERLVREVAAAQCPSIVFLLDTGHAHMTGGIAAAIRAAGSNIKYTHVHDNDGKTGWPIMAFRGTLPWEELREGLHNAGYDGVFLLEVFESTADLPNLLDETWQARIRRILSPDED